MATTLEIQIEQRRRLFGLLQLKAMNDGLEIKGLDNLIVATIAEMSQEDVSWVRENVAQLKL